MFGSKEVLKLANEAFKLFSMKHNVDVVLELVNETEFWNLALQSQIVKEEVEDKLPLKIAALMVHKRLDRIVLCTNIINKLNLSKGKLIAVIMHELYHVLDKDRIKHNTLTDCIKSEERVNEHFRNDFPQIAKLINFKP